MEERPPLSPRELRLFRGAKAGPLSLSLEREPPARKRARPASLALSPKKRERERKRLLYFFKKRKNVFLLTETPRDRFELQKFCC